MGRSHTEKQEKLALEYAHNGGNATAAAKAAGYSPATAHEIGRQNLAKPQVSEMIRVHLLGMKARSGALGLKVLAEISQDEKAPHSARVSAARALCEHAGLLGGGKEQRSLADVVNGDLLNSDWTLQPEEVLSAFRRANSGIRVIE